MAHMQRKAGNRDCLDKEQDVGVRRQKIEAALTIMFKELEEIILWKVKEAMMTLSC